MNTDPRQLPRAYQAVYDMVSAWLLRVEEETAKRDPFGRRRKVTGPNVGTALDRSPPGRDGSGREGSPGGGSGSGGGGAGWGGAGWGFGSGSGFVPALIPGPDGGGTQLDPGDVIEPPPPPPPPPPDPDPVGPFHPVGPTPPRIPYNPIVEDRPPPPDSPIGWGGSIHESSPDPDVTSAAWRPSMLTTQAGFTDNFANGAIEAFWMQTNGTWAETVGAALSVSSAGAGSVGALLAYGPKSDYDTYVIELDTGDSSTIKQGVFWHGDSNNGDAFNGYTATVQGGVLAVREWVDGATALLGSIGFTNGAVLKVIFTAVGADCYENGSLVLTVGAAVFGVGRIGIVAGNGAEIPGPFTASVPP